MLSSGGLATPAIARRFPIRMLESGPAGGALATALVGRSCSARPHQLRHGRHDGEGVADPGQPGPCRADDGSRARAPLQEGQRLSRAGTGRGDDRDRAGGGSIAHVDESG